MSRQKSRNPTLRLACALTLVAASVGVSGCARSGESKADDAPAKAVTVGVVKVTRQDLSNSLRIASEFIPFQQIDVTAKVSGYVKKLYIDWGTHVRQGQLLAVLEVPELDAQVAKDMAAVQRAEKDVARSEQDLSRTESAYNVAHVTYTRFAGVQKARPDLISQEEVDVAHAKDLETSASVSATQDALAAAQQELSVAKSMLDKDKAFLNYARITAPFDGVVTKLDAYTGALLPAGTSNATSTLSLCRLSQNNVLRLVIPVPERVVPDVHLGEHVNVQVTTLRKVFQGTVIRYADEIDLETRTMHTEVQVANPKYEIVPGMYAYVQIPVKSVKNALTLPLQAVQMKGNNQGTILSVNRQNQIVQRQVQLGLETASEVQIVSGVHEGEMAVFGELSRFHPGERVKPETANLTSLAGAE